MMLKTKQKILMILTLLFTSISFAIIEPTSGIGGIATNVTNTFTSFAKLITAGSYLGGLGLAFIAILKFKEYRDANPGQKKLGIPIVYLLIAVALLFLPHLTKEAATTMFGTGATAGSISGETGLDNI